MKKNICRVMLLWAALVVVILSLPLKAEALEPRLLWEKTFKYKIGSVDLATVTGEVILGLGNGEIILYDKNGKERFHWGPRADRAAGHASISKDGKYFAFSSGYKWQYAEKKGLAQWEDNRIHFYNAQTKKELWNIKGTEGGPRLSPDSLSIIVTWEGGGFDLYNLSGQKIAKGQSGHSFAFSPDGGYFAVAGNSHMPLMLFKRDGTELWEKGRHEEGIASISEGASYISTYPYVLAYDSPDSQNTHLGTVYDKNGNKILEGLGIVSGNGAKIAMYSSDKITILSLPNKTTLKEIPIKVELPKFSNLFFAAFSYDGRYLAVRGDNSILIFDLVDNVRKDITIPGFGISPRILFTTEGKYLLVRPGDSAYKKTLYYYQLY